LTSIDNSQLNRLPSPWLEALSLHLGDGEQLLASLEIDLNQELQFSNGLVCLTNLGLIAYKNQNISNVADPKSWIRWGFAQDLDLQTHDHGGVATLELVNKAGRLASWRFTLAQNPAANRLIQQYKIEQAKSLGHRHPDGDLVGQPVCPTCWVPLPLDQDECPACTSENLTAPSTWTLFRLWRFAKPYKGQLLAGFLLTLASTAATLVPPYLTMPLMDEILLPYQSGQAIDRQLTLYYLSALFLAALLAWGLGWAHIFWL
jgi:ATP-binding cassette subfamily B protein